MTSFEPESVLLAALLMGPAIPSVVMFVRADSWEFGLVCALAQWGAYIVGLLSGHLLRDLVS